MQVEKEVRMHSIIQDVSTEKHTMKMGKNWWFMFPFIWRKTL